MAKRNDKAAAALTVGAIVIGVPILLVTKLIESVGWVFPVVVIAAAISFFVWYQQDKKKRRIEYLRNKYQDEDVVQKILGMNLWQGQTEEQLRDSIGSPVAVDRAVLKTKSKEVWKYQQQGAKRFGLRVTVENGKVIGWDKKGSPD